MEYELFSRKLREQFPNINIPEEYLQPGHGSVKKLFLYLESQGINTDKIRLESHPGSKILREPIIGRKLKEDLEENLNNTQLN